MTNENEWSRKPLRFKRRLSDVEAVLIKEDNIEEVAAWCGGRVAIENGYRGPHSEMELVYPTLQGPVRTQSNRWLVRDENGRFETLSEHEFKRIFEYDKSVNKVQNHANQSVFSFGTD